MIIFTTNQVGLLQQSYATLKFVADIGSKIGGGLRVIR